MELKFIILFLALVVDRIVGDPRKLWQTVPHPVVLFGKAIGLMEKRYNRSGLPAQTLRRHGMWVLLALLLLVVVIGTALISVLSMLGFIGVLIEIAIVAVFLAQKSLADHVGDVAAGLRRDGLQGGRLAVSMIVGRDPQNLDEAGICRAAIESLAENASDGIVAPAFWFVLFGLPGLFAYKLINTADSMIGHLNERYRDFGRFAALLDDAVNWLPARLTGLLAVIAVWLDQGKQVGQRAYRVMKCDARLHRSPNAGWPEAAFAGALDLALGGPRQYGGTKINEPMLNEDGRRQANVQDIDAALKLFWKTMTVLAGLVILASLVIYRQ